MRINHNIAALNTHRQLNTASTAQSKSMEKLSSGLRINKAGDDAAGLAISEKMRGQIRGLDMASKNAQDGISMIQTAEGALNETHDILQRMRELAVQSGNDTNTDSDRGELQKEVDQLAQEITRIANNTEFNTQTLLNGGITDTGLGEVKFQIGANKGQNISLDIKAMDAKSLGVARDVNTASLDDAATGITKMEVSSTSNLAEGTHAVTVSDVAAIGAAADLATDIQVSVKSASSYAGDNGNGVKVVLNVTAGAAASSFDTSSNTLTINATSGSQTDIAAAIAAGNSDVTDNFEITGAGTATATAGNTTLADGADAKLKFTLGTNEVTVATDATSVKFANSGLTLTKDVSATAASDFDNVNITISSEKATAATALGDGTMSEAVAEAGINISSQSDANSAIETINKAIETVSAERSKLGATQNRLEHTINNLNTSSENLTAAESRVRDVDYALAA